MKTFSDLIAELGGPAALASTIGANVEAVRKMAKRNSVPAHYWQALVDVSRAKRVSGVTIASLATMQPARKPYTRSTEGNATVGDKLSTGKRPNLGSAKPDKTPAATKRRRPAERATQRAA